MKSYPLDNIAFQGSGAGWRNIRLSTVAGWLGIRRPVDFRIFPAGEGPVADMRLATVDRANLCLIGRAIQPGCPSALECGRTACTTDTCPSVLCGREASKG